MQLFPLVKMYYTWILEEDETNIRVFMLQFGFELELELHELGTRYSSLSGMMTLLWIIFRGALILMHCPILSMLLGRGWM